MRTLTGIIVALLVSAPVSAAPFTWEITGRMTQPTGWPESPFGGLFRRDQPYSWTLSFESSVPDLFPENPACGSYDALQATSFTSGPVSLAELRPFSRYLVAPSRQGCPQPLPGPATLAVGFEADLLLGLTMHGQFGTDALLIDPRLITQASLTVSSRGFLLATASVDSIRLVPEPASVVMIGLGILWRCRRLRRRSTSQCQRGHSRTSNLRQAARGASLAAFDECCIPPAGVASRTNTSGTAP